MADILIWARKATKIEKTFTGLKVEPPILVVGHTKIDAWDGERAKVDVNGVTCWTSKSFTITKGLKFVEIVGTKID